MTELQVSSSSRPFPAVGKQVNVLLITNALFDIYTTRPRGVDGTQIELPSISIALQVQS